MQNVELYWAVRYRAPCDTIYPVKFLNQKQKLKTVKKVGVKSVAKLHGAIMGFMMGIMSLIMFVFSLIGALMGGDLTFVFFGLAIAIGGTLAGFVIGYVQGAIGAFIYNVVAGKLGELR